MNPYTPVSGSTAKQSSDEYVPHSSQQVGVRFGGEGVTDERFVVENSFNAFAWVEGRGDASFVDLYDMR